MSEVHEKLSIGEKISHTIAIKEVFAFDIFGFHVSISDTVVGMWIIMAIIILAAFLLTRKFKDLPSKPQLVVEALVDFINNFAEQNIGHHGRPFAAFLGTIFIFLIVANIAPIITPVGGFGFEPAVLIKPITRDINVAAALAITVILTVIISGIAKKGIRAYLGKFLKPIPFMLPFNILEYVIKPMSLSLRLFGNILGAYIIMVLVEAVVPIALPPVAALYFDLFDGLIQAVIFTFLSTMYIAEVVE